MKELVFDNNGQIVTNSLLVAEKFEKNHNQLLRDIDELIKGVSNFGHTLTKGSAENSAHLFHETTYIHPQNKQEYRMYLMNRDGFSLLVMGFTGQKAFKFKLDFINAFNQYEKIAKNPVANLTKIDLAQMVIESEREKALLQEQNQEQQKLLEAQAPKVLFTDAVIGSQSSCLVGELAKIITQNGYTIGEKRLFKWLRENNYLGNVGERYNIPNQQYIERGLFELKKGTRSGNNGVMHTTITPKITGKGQVYFMNKFLSKTPVMA